MWRRIRRGGNAGHFCLSGQSHYYITPGETLACVLDYRGSALFYSRGFQKLGKSGPVEPAEIGEFDHVDFAFPLLNLADVGVVDLELPGRIRLREPGADS